jgi:hypothetical protein
MVLGSHLDLPKGAHGVHHLVMHHIAEDHRRGKIHVAHSFLHEPDIGHPVEVCGEPVVQHVWIHRLENYDVADRPLHHRTEITSLNG